MNHSFLLELAVKRLTPLLMLLSLWVLYRGHHLPGGGFIGGLMAACALSLYSLGFGPAATRAYLRVDPQRLMGIGVALSLLAGLLAMAAGKNFLTGLWIEIPLPGEDLKLGTPLLFDAGVYLTVIGVTVSILLALEEG